MVLSDKIRKLGNGLSFHRVENESSFTIKVFMKEDATSVLCATRSLISKGSLDIIHEGKCDHCAMCNNEFDI